MTEAFTGPSRPGLAATEDSEVRRANCQTQEGPEKVLCESARPSVPEALRVTNHFYFVLVLLLRISTSKLQMGVFYCPYSTVQYLLGPGFIR